MVLADGATQSMMVPHRAVPEGGVAMVLDASLKIPCTLLEVRAHTDQATPWGMSPHTILQAMRTRVVRGRKVP